MKTNTAIVIINLALILLTAFSVYITESLWSLMILLLMFQNKGKELGGKLNE